jgi:hypothetical protein
MFPITSFTASLGHDGDIDIFAVALSPQAPKGQGVTVFRIRQKKAGGDWQPWENVGKPGHGAVGVRSITDVDGHGHTLVDNAAGYLWFNERQPDDTFSGWQPLGVPPLDPANSDFAGDQWRFIYMWGVTRTDGQIDVAGTAGSDTDRGIFLRSRPAHATSWTPWGPLLGDNDFFGDIVAVTDYAGGVDIVTPIEVSTDAAGLAHKRRLPDGTWTDWTMLGNPPGGLSEDITPVLVNGADSPLGPELFAVAVDSTIWHNAQTSAGDWSDWASLGNTGGPVTGLAVAQDGGGALNVCLTHEDNTVTYRSQEGLGGAWADWTSLGAPDASAVANPALILDSEYNLNLLLTRPDKDGMITLRQTSDGRFVKGPAIPALPPASGQGEL